MRKVLLSLIFAVLFSTVFISLHAQSILTLAGNGSIGYSGDGGAAILAKFYNPAGVAIDASGNVYVADQFNNVVRKITPLGIISTYAGNDTAADLGDGGPATLASLSIPSGVAVDAAGNLFIADQNNNLIRKVDPFGIISSVAGTGAPGFTGDGSVATSAAINAPTAVAVDASGNLYFTDNGNNRIRMVNDTGTITTIAGNGIVGSGGDGGAATTAQFSGLRGIAVDNAGNIFVTDAANNKVRKINAAGIISTFAGSGTSGYSGDGGQATAAGLYQPYGVAADNMGNVLIADFENNRIRKVSASGIISTIAGNGTPGFSGDGGPAGLAGLNKPAAVATDASGRIFIADEYNNRIRWITTTEGLNALPALQGLTIFPNPSKGGFNIYVSSLINERAAIDVFDITGQIRMKYTVETNHLKTVETGLPSGIYFLMVVTTQSKEVVKIVVQ